MKWCNMNFKSFFFIKTSNIFQVGLLVQISTMGWRSPSNLSLFFIVGCFLIVVWEVWKRCLDRQNVFKMSNTRSNLSHNVSFYLVKKNRASQRMTFLECFLGFLWSDVGETLGKINLTPSRTFLSTPKPSNSTREPKQGTERNTEKGQKRNADTRFMRNVFHFIRPVIV